MEYKWSWLILTSTIIVRDIKADGAQCITSGYMGIFANQCTCERGSKNPELELRYDFGDLTIDSIYTNDTEIYIAINSVLKDLVFEGYLSMVALQHIAPFSTTAFTSVKSIDVSKLENRCSITTTI